MNKTQAKRLKDLRTIIELNPWQQPGKALYMGCWKRETMCGTVSCLAGEYVLQFPRRDLTFQRSDWGSSDDVIIANYWIVSKKDPEEGGEEVLMEHFGLTDDQVEDLFIPDSYEGLDVLTEAHKKINRYLKEYGYE